MPLVLENYGVGVQEGATAADPGAAGTTLTLAAATIGVAAASTLGQQTHILVQNALGDPTNREIMVVTAGQGSTSLTVVRGQEGTTGVAHPVGSYVAVVDTPEVRRRHISNQVLLPYHWKMVAFVCPPYLIDAGQATAPVAGAVACIRIPIAEKITVSNFIVNQVVAGVTLTNCYLGLYDKTGARLGLSADQSANWTTANAARIVAATAPFVVDPGTDANYFVWGALLVGSAGTLPTFRAGNTTTASVNVNVTAAADPPFSANAGSALTALPATLGTLGQANSSPWMGLS